MPDDRDEGANAPTGVQQAATDDTLVPAAGSSSSQSSTGFSAAATTTRVGDDLRAVSLSRFGSVERERFEVLGELARGGLGRVYRARDPRTGRVVALKEVLRPSADLLVRFAREALVTANLQHPSIVPVYEVGRWPGGEPFYAMKLVQGRALDEVIAQARTTAARVALVPHIIAIADALAYAHGEHVIHRDLKPANVLVGAYGETVVIDWGLARNLAGGPGGGDESQAPTLPPIGPGASTPGETMDGAVVGTPAYMPPEQAKGQALDERADVYAIGAILYHVLTGERPYSEARTIAEVLVRVGKGPPRPLGELVLDAPRELVAIVERAMARAPAERYPTALELAEDLRRFVSGQLVGAHQYTRWQLLRRWIGRNRAAVLTAVVALAALAVFGVVSVRRIADQRDEARRQHDRAERARSAAQSARALAEQRFAASLEELGRQALRDGAADRALVFLSGARAAQPAGGAVLDLLLGQARAGFNGLVAVVPGHVGGTVSADLSPDGTRLVSTSTTEVRMWGVAGGQELWRADGIHHARFSPRGDTVLAAGYDGAVSLRDAVGGAVLATWTVTPLAPGEQVTMLAWASDGAGFAVGTNGGRVAVGAPGRGALATADPHGKQVYGLRFSPTGRLLLSCAEDGGVMVRDPSTAAVRARLVPAGGPPAVACTWNGDSAVLAGDGGGTVRMLYVDHSARITPMFQLAHGPDMYGLTSWSGGILTYGDGAVASVWDPSFQKVVARLGGHHAAVSDAIVVGGWLVTADEAGALFVWDARSGALLQSLPREGLASLAVRGDTLITFGEGRTRMWNLAPEATRRAVPGHSARVRDLVFDAAGTTVWTASNDGSARGYDLASGEARTLGAADFREPDVRDPSQVATTTANPRGLRSLTLSPDGAHVVTASEDGTIGVWRAADGGPVATWLGHTGRVRRVVFARGGTVAYSVGDHTLRRWDAVAGKEVARADLGEAGWDVALLGDDVVVTLGDDRKVALWDAATLAPRAAPEVAVDRLRELVIAGDRIIISTEDQVVALDRDGKVVARAAHYGAFAADPAGTDGPIAAGDPRSEVVLHDRATLAPLRSWRTGDVVVAAVRFRPDGAILATAGGRRVRVWDPATGRALLESPEMAGMITQLAWSRDGRWLAFGGGSGTMWLWDLAPPPVRDLDGFTRCASPWRLDDSTLTAAPFDPAACAALR